MLLTLELSLWAVRCLALSRQALVLDNLALRPQLAVAARGGCRPRLVTIDRAFSVALRAVWADWATSWRIAAGRSCLLSYGSGLAGSPSEFLLREARGGCMMKRGRRSSTSAGSSVSAVSELVSMVSGTNRPRM